jgi:hypothetical protein
MVIPAALLLLIVFVQIGAMLGLGAFALLR